MAKLTNTEKTRIIELHKKGYSSRKIAKELFGSSKKRRTTIQDYIVKNSDQNIKNEFNIIILDIETSPSLSYHWQRYDVNIMQDQVVSESFILTYSVKFLGNDNVICGFLEPDEVDEENDYRLVKELFDILNDVDVVIAHNGKQFDLKYINTRLIYHGFPPPTPYRVIDTLQIARRNFRFPSNKLNDLCVYMGIGGKIETGGFKLWRGYLRGNEDAIETMIEYNMQDVLILEEVYLKLRAWDNGLVNHNIFSESDVCPCCGSNSFENTGKFLYTSVNLYETFRCRECGRIFKNRSKVKNKKVNFVNV